MAEITLFEIPYILKVTLDIDNLNYTMYKYNPQDAKWYPVNTINIITNQTIVYGDILPATDGLSNIGNALLRFASITSKALTIKTENPEIVLQGDESGAVPFSIKESAGIFSVVNKVANSDEISIDTANNLIKVARHLKPATANALDIGDSTNKFRNAYLSGDINVDSNANIGGDVVVGGKATFKNVDLKKSATSSAVASGGTPTYSDITPDAGYNAIFPYSIRITPSGLATGETLTVYIKATYSDGTTAEITKTGVTGETYLTLADIHALIKAGVYITKISVGAVSNLTTTSASVTMEVVGLQH